MTREDFLQMSESQRKYLIKEAHTYYASGFNEDLSKVSDPEVRDFIEMCLKERMEATTIKC